MAKPKEKIEEIEVLEDFNLDENKLIKRAVSRFKLENEIVKFEDSRGNVEIAINAYHDRFGMINTPQTHKTMRNILRKCGVKIEEPEERTSREEKELKMKRKEVKRKLREQVKKRHKEEQEKEIADMGLKEEEEIALKEPEPPRKDITSVETFSNIPETLEQNAKEKEAAKEVSDVEKDFPGFDYVALSKNTVVELKKMADYLEITFEPTILKKDLIIKIRAKIE